MDKFIGALNVPNDLLYYIGVDMIKYFDRLIISYYILMFIVFLNTYKIFKDYKHIKLQKHNKILFTKYDLYITTIISFVYFISLTFVGVFIEYGIYSYFYHSIVLLILSIIFFLIQYYIYLKINNTY